MLPAHIGIAPEDRVSEAFNNGITAESERPSQKHSVMWGLQLASLGASMHPIHNTGIKTGP